MEKDQERPLEKVSRLGRNINVAVGVGALVVGVLAPGTREFMVAFAALQGAQAVAFEGLRRYSKNRRTAATT